MAQRNEIAAVYVAAVIQGLALVTFPAASTIFTSPEHYGLSSTEYGSVFVPQAITAILASLLGAGLIRRLGIKRIYLFGLTADLVSMALLFLSQFVISDGRVAYSMLLLATASLGIGFGLTVPALNTFTAAFFPQKIGSAVLVPQRTARAGDGVGSGVCRCFHRFGHLVGAASSCSCVAAFIVIIQPVPAASSGDR